MKVPLTDALFIAALGMSVVFLILAIAYGLTHVIRRFLGHEQATDPVVEAGPHVDTPSSPAPVDEEADAVDMETQTAQPEEAEPVNAELMGAILSAVHRYEQDQKDEKMPDKSGH